MEGFGIDTLKVWNLSKSPAEYYIVVEVTRGSQLQVRKTCFPNEMIGYDFSVVSGPVSSILKFSLYKKKTLLSPLVEPIEVAIPMTDNDICLVINGTYATAAKKYVPCSEPEGIKLDTQTSQGSDHIVQVMPLFVHHSPVSDHSRAPNSRRP